MYRDTLDSNVNFVLSTITNDFTNKLTDPKSEQKLFLWHMNFVFQKINAFRGSTLRHFVIG